jgi:hypothetical protein
VADVYKKDYIYLRLGDQPPVKVPVNEMVPLMVKGYKQCPPPEEKKKEE